MSILDWFYESIGIQSTSWKEFADQLIIATLAIICVIQMGVSMTAFWFSFILMLDMVRRDDVDKSNTDENV